MKKLFILLVTLLFTMGVFVQNTNAERSSVQVTATEGTTGPTDYTTLKTAFDAINNGTHQGDIIIKIKASTTETASAVLNASSSGSGSAIYTSVNIYPTGPGRSISANLEAPLIDLNGADNVTIDGRIDATGSDINLTIKNTSVSNTSSTIRFINDASANTVKYCRILGSSTATTGGIVFFSTGSTDGNDGNLIDNNNITNSLDANRPVNVVYSSGTVGVENSGNTISNNNIYDFLNRALATSSGIFLSDNTTAWTISGNSFYETNNPFVPTAGVSYTVINIFNPSGDDFTISNNFIGGSSSDHSGKFTINSAMWRNFTGIYLYVGSTTASSVQNNTIQNIDYSTGTEYAFWTGIKVFAGKVNIGTITGNTIGSNTGIGSVTITNTTYDMSFYGIHSVSGIVDIRNNNIGSIILASPSTKGQFFTGLILSENTTAINNTIGSPTEANSIYASSAATNSSPYIRGISGGGSCTITDNTIANMTNGANSSISAYKGSIIGMLTGGADNTITNNTIRDLTIANANTSSDYQASIIGISHSANAEGNTISGNTIFNLSNTYPSFAGSVVGLSFGGGYTGTNLVSNNFIHSLSVTGASSTAASIYGIKKEAGVCSFANNIITLGGNTSTNIYGISLSSGSESGTNVYFNTVYIGGNPVSGSNNSHAFSYSVSSSAAKNIRNNIFVNARSNNGASGMHYAAYFVNNYSITLDYNNYYAPGTGGYLGYYNYSSTNTLPLIPSKDVFSTNVDPVFATAGSITASDYLPSNTSLVAAAETGVTTDFDGSDARSVTYPAMGAFEYTVIPCFNPSSGGTIASDQSGCITLNPVAITSSEAPSGAAGTLEYKWQVSTTSSSSDFSDISSSNSETYDAGTITQTTWYKRIARVTCKADWTGAVASNVVEITISPVSVGGTVSGGITLCGGASSDVLTLSGQTGSVSKWQSSVSPFDSWTDIANTNTTYTPGTLTQTTQFRAVVNSGACSEANSAATTVTISSEPASVGGTISGSSDPLEFGASTGTLTLSGSTGTVLNWQKMLDSDSWTDISNPATTLSEIPSSSGTWQYRAQVQSADCPAAYSDAWSIEVLKSASSIPNTSMWVPNNTVYAIASDETYTYIGGDFTSIGPLTGSGVELTASSSIPSPAFPKVDGEIYATASDGVGGWYIGGDFTKVGNFDRNNIAHINSSGEVTAWDPDAENDVYAIALSGTDIYVGGYFEEIGGLERYYIAKLNNTDGAADDTWNPDADDEVDAIAVSGTDIYLGGYFEYIGGQDRYYIAKLNNTDGAADDTWNPDAGSNVYTIAVSASGTEIYVGGRFYEIGGQDRKYIAKLNNTDGAADGTWNPDPDDRVRTIAVSASGTEIYVGGDFEEIGGQDRNYIAKLDNISGAADANWNPSSNDGVKSISVSGTNIYVGGYFTSIGGTPRNYIARYKNSDGSLDNDWNPNADDDVKTLALNGTDIYAGGYFENIGGQARSYIAKLDNTIGAADATWTPEANSTVNTLAISGSDIYAGGEFDYIGGQARNYIAKLNDTDGAADATWTPEANSDVITLAISGDDIYVGGDFSTIGGQTRNYIAKLNNTNGAADATWNPDADYKVYSIATSISDIYAGGGFNNIGGQNRNYIAKLNNTNGAANLEWNPDANSYVYAIAINGYDNYVGGEFDYIGGESQSYFAKFTLTYCTNPTSGGTIAADQTICTGTAPVAITSTTLPNGHDGTLEYKWQSSTTNASSGFADIESSNSETYTPGTLITDTWYKRLARVDCMSDWTEAVESNVVKMTVNAASAGGSVSGGTSPIDLGSSTETMTLSGHTGTILKWQKMVDSGSWEDIICTALVYSEIPSSAGTWQYRAQVKSGACPEAFSEPSTIIVTSNEAATVTLGGLVQTYNGTGTTATATTSPAGLTVIFTYDGSSALPVNAGTYTVVGTIDDDSYEGTATADMVISKATATVTLTGLSVTYDGREKTPVVTTSPAGLATSLTYTDVAKFRLFPINAGSYLFTATISDTNYQGSTTGTLVISKATATVTLGGLTATYDGTTHAATATTSPAGLNVGITYDGSSSAPVNAGTYAVAGTVDNANYQGSATGNMVISKATATVTLSSNYTVTYDGNTHGASATTSPAGISVNITYNGSSSVPANAGTYVVEGTISSTNYHGSATGSIVITKASQTITSFSTIPDGLRVTEKYQLAATSSSGLPVRFESSEASVVAISGSELEILREGSAQITACQDGDNNWNPATDVSQTIQTLPTFDNIRSLFTPNNDGMNDTWYIPDIEQYGNISVQIYNRFGKLIYESPAYKNDWDGTYNNTPLPSASYYYLIKSSEKGIIKGVVNLVR